MVTAQKSAIISFNHQKVDEVQEILSRRFAPVMITPYLKSGEISLSGEYGLLPGIDFEHSVVGDGFDIRPLKKDSAYFLLFPTFGEITFSDGKRALSATSALPVCADGDHTEVVKASTGLDKTAIKIDKTLVMSRLGTLLEIGSVKGLQFHALVNPREAKITALVSFTRYLLSSPEGRMLQSLPFTAKQLSNTLTDLFLEAWPHNFSESLSKPPASIAPRHVRRAISFLREHYMKDISVEDVARACGVSLRALQYGFRDFVGVSVSQYHRRLRLEQAKQLLKDDSSLSVSDVARICGFTNVHRFSQYFTSAFGTHPSAVRD